MVPLVKLSQLPIHIPFRILFLNNLSLRSCLKAIVHAPQPHSTIGNITVLYILILKFLERSREDTSIRTKEHEFDALSLYFTRIST